MTADALLTRRLVAGEEAAFEEFFADYFPRLYRFARARLAGDEDAAEEAVQAVMISAVRKIHTYRGDAALFTWLCTLCRHEIARSLERRGKFPEVPLLEDDVLIRGTLETLTSPAGDDPENEFDRRELARLVQVTLDHLPAKYGDALEWKYLQGLTIEEIGLRLGLGYKAVESLLTRARQAFRDGFPDVATRARSG